MRAPMSRWHTVVGLYLAPAAICCSLAHAQQPMFTGLGMLPDTTSSTALDVSDDGTVVVGRCDGSGAGGAGSRAFRWTLDGGMADLGALPGAVGAQSCGTNSDGSVIVGSSGEPATPFRWTADSGMVSLGTLPGFTSGIATAVNADGSVVVGYCESGGQSVAFRWTAGDGMTSLGTLAGAGWSQANGVSADGQMVVGASGNRGFAWNEKAGMTPMGSVSNECSSFSTTATSINSSGGPYIAGSVSQYTCGCCGPSCGVACMNYYLSYLFRWSPSQGMIHMSMGQASYSNVYMSSDGSLLVTTVTFWGFTDGMFWHHRTGWMYVFPYLGSLGLNVAGWGTSFAKGVSADGRTIIGSASHAGTTEAWVAVIPNLSGEPGDVNADGVVNISDLLDVLSSWGPCPPYGAACPGDIDPAAGDFLININDLLQVLNNWG